MLVIRNLIKKKISKLFVVSALSCALVFASLYGVVRESFNYSEDDSFTLGIDNKEEKFKTEWMEFGTFPLSKVTAVNNVDLTFGATYLTVFTNFVPRFFWPSKPDPGGVVFTRDYAPGLYDEYSQYTTGIFPEAIINFGIYFGTFLGVFQLISFFILISFFHIKYFSNLFIVNSHKNIFFVVGYVYSLWAFPIFLTGEFTNIAIGLIIKFLVLMLCYSYLRLSKFT